MMGKQQAKYACNLPAFALWSNAPPDDEVQQALREVFTTCEMHIIAFNNVQKDGEVTNTVMSQGVVANIPGRAHIPRLAASHHSIPLIKVDHSRALRRSHYHSEARMAQFPIMKTLANIAVTHVDGEYRIRIEDQSGDTAAYRALSDQVSDLADILDDLLTDEDEEETAG
jgi:hypothetical protein